MDLIDVIFCSVYIVISILLAIGIISYLISKFRKPEPLPKTKNLVPYIIPSKPKQVISKPKKEPIRKVKTFDQLPKVSKKPDKFKRVHDLQEGIVIKEKLKTSEILKYYDDGKQTHK